MENSPPKKEFGILQNGFSWARVWCKKKRKYCKQKFIWMNIRMPWSGCSADIRVRWLLRTAEHSPSIFSNGLVPTRLVLLGVLGDSILGQDSSIHNTCFFCIPLSNPLITAIPLYNISYKSKSSCSKKPHCHICSQPSYPSLSYRTYTTYTTACWLHSYKNYTLSSNYSLQEGIFSWRSSLFSCMVPKHVAQCPDQLITLREISPSWYRTLFHTHRGLFTSP